MHHETDQERQRRMAQEHFDKYAALARRIGWDACLAAVPFTAAEVCAALEAGDEPLNTLPLARWDRAAGAIPLPDGDFRWGPTPEWLREHRTLSLGERVCVLKHVARVAFGGAQRP
jgi:hypothetical protein